MECFLADVAALVPGFTITDAAPVTVAAVTRPTFTWARFVHAGHWWRNSIFT